MFLISTPAVSTRRISTSRPARGLQVEGQRPLVAVQVLEVAVVPAAPERVPRGLITGRLAGRLHADDVSPPVGQLANTVGPARDDQVDDTVLASEHEVVVVPGFADCPAFFNLPGLVRRQRGDRALGEFQRALRLGRRRSGGTALPCRSAAGLRA